MAPRNKEQLLVAYETQFSKPFDMAPFDALRAVVGDKATDAAILARLRELLPTSGNEETIDYVAQFLAVDTNAAALQNMRKAIAHVASLVKAARESGSKMSIGIDMDATDADSQVKLHNKTRAPRSDVNRKYSDLADVFRANDISEISYKLGEVTVKLPVKLTTPKTDKDGKQIECGAQYRYDGKWYAIETLNSHVKDTFKREKDSGARASSAVNTWVTVKAQVGDKSRSIANLYDEWDESNATDDSDEG